LEDSIYHYAYVLYLKNEHILEFMDITVGHVWEEGEEIKMFEEDENETVTKLR